MVDSNQMRLTDRQLQAFRKNGFLFLPGRFQVEEVAPLRKEARRVYKLDRPEVWRLRFQAASEAPA